LKSNLVLENGAGFLDEELEVIIGLLLYRIARRPMKL
jgi:hypothetical protein